MKKLNWAKIPNRQLTPSTFWAKTKEGELENQDLFLEINDLFASKTAKGAHSSLL